MSRIIQDPNGDSELDHILIPNESHSPAFISVGGATLAIKLTREGNISVMAFPKGKEHEPEIHGFWATTLELK